MPARLVFLLVRLACLPAAVAGEATSGATVSGPPVSPAPDALISRLNGEEIQELLQWISRHAVDPEMLSQENLNRAALAGLLLDTRTGARILSRSALPWESPPAPLYALWENSAAYLRPPEFSPESIAALDTFLASLPSEVHTLLLDLRAPQPPQPLSGAAAFVSLFLPPDLPLFLLTSQGSPDPVLVRTAAGSAPPSPGSVPDHSRRLWLLTDDRTPAASALAAHLLARHAPTLSFGSPAGGEIMETTDRPLGPDHILRLPSATASWPDGARLTGTRFVPAIPVPSRPEARNALFSLTDPAGLPELMAEVDRPRLNEAALMAGTRPEITAALPMARPDPVLQQAFDLLRTSRVLRLDAPEEVKKATPGP